LEAFGIETQRNLTDVQTLGVGVVRIHSREEQYPNLIHVETISRISLLERLSHSAFCDAL
jgi:hypothetical protein